MADINLTGDANQLVKAIDQATAAFINFNKTTAQVQKDQTKFNAQGEAVARTLVTIDGAGNKLVTTFKKVEDVIEQTSVATRTASENFKALQTTVKAAADAQKFYERAAAEAAKTAATVQDPALVAVAEKLKAQAAAAIAASDAQEALAVAQKNSGAAAAARVKGARLEAEADRLATAAIKAKQAAAASAVTTLNTLAASERARQLSAAGTAAIAGGEAQVGAVGAKRAGKGARIRALAAEGKTELDAQRKLFKSLEAQRQQDLKQRARIQAQALEQLKNDLRREEQATRESAKKQAEAYQVKVKRRKEQEAQILNDLKVELAREERATRESARKQAAAFKEIQVQRKRTADAERVTTLRRPDTDFRTVAEGGKASRRAVEGFLAAENAAKRLIATGKIGFAEFSTALTAAQANALKLADNLTVAERAALRLVAAENQLRTNTEKTTKSTNQLADGVRSLGRLVGISLLIGGAFRLVQAFSDASKAAAEFSIRIAEIQTISNEAATDTEQWAEQLRTLSGAFGIDTLTQAEGAYQALSSQIKNANGEVLTATETIQFLDAANRLAVTGVTDVAASTDLLTSAINAFNIPTEQAELTSAKFFETVRLGKLRIEELAQGFGRVAVPAAQLGIRFEELLGLQARITNQGVKLNEANTLIRGILLKLIRPTDRLKEVFRELGVANGEQLIAARGTVGAFEAIEKAVGSSTTELGAAFGRVRAITGALVFAGKGAREAADAIASIDNATTKAFSEKTNLVINSTGQQLRIAAAEAQNFFEQFVGTPLTQGIARFIKDVGGARRLLEDLSEDLKITGQLLAGLFTAKILAGVGAYVAAIKSATGATGAYAVAQASAAAATNATAAAIGRLTLATKAGVAGLVVLGGLLTFARNRREQLRALEAANLEQFEVLKQRRRDSQNIENQRTQDFKREIQNRFRAAIRFNTDLIAKNNETATALKKTAEVTTREFNALLKNLTAQIGRNLTDARNRVNKFTKESETALKSARNILATEAQSQLTIDIETAGLGNRLKILQQEIAAARGDVEKAVEAGSVKEFEVARKRLNEFIKLRVEAEVAFATERSKINRDLQNAERDRITARTRKEREAADARIRDIRRQLKILENGSAAQLTQERELQKVRKQAEEAQDAAALTDALERLAALKREQERINKVAEEERKIRARTAAEAKKQAEQAKAIADENKRQAEEARKQEQRIKALQLAFELVKNDSKAFRVERVTAGKKEVEINKAVAEQQRRLAQLITIGRQLTGDRSLDPVLIKRDEDLRAQAEVRIRDIRLKAINDQLKADEKLLTNRKTAVDKEADLENRRIQQSVKTLQDFQRLQFGSDPRTRATNIGRAFGTPIAPDLSNIGELTNRFDVLVAQGKTLEKLLAQQQKSFDAERQRGIQEIVSFIIREVRPGRIRRADAQERGPGLSNLTDEDLRRRKAALAFALAAEKAASASGRLGDSQKKQRTLLERLNTIRRKAGVENAKVQTAQNDALIESEKIIARFNKSLKDREALSKPGVDFGIPGPVQPSPFKELFKDLDERPLSDKLKDATRDGLKRGSEEAKATLTKNAQDRGKAEAEAKVRAERTLASINLKKRIKTLEEDIEKRRTAATRATLSPQGRPQLPEARQVDDRIRFGPGAPSIAAQQARIAREVAKRNEEQAAIRKAEREQRQEELRRQSAGFRPGQFIGGARPGTFLGGPRPGQFTGGPRPGQSLIPAQQLTVQEQQLDEQKKTNALLAGRTQADAVKALRLARGGGVSSKLDQQLQIVTEQELLEKQQTIEQARLLGVSQEKASQLLGRQNGVTAETIAEQERLRDILRRNQDAIATGTASTGLGSRDPFTRALRSRQLQTQTRPFPVLAPPQTPATSTTEVGGINITIVESASPQATAREVVRVVNRGVRRGTVRLGR